jgi:hypothetical protein
MIRFFRKDFLLCISECKDLSVIWLPLIAVVVDMPMDDKEWSIARSSLLTLVESDVEGTKTYKKDKFRIVILRIILDAYTGCCRSN